MLYSVHSILKVMEYSTRKQAAEIRQTVLIDRGATRLPVRAYGFPWP